MSPVAEQVLKEALDLADDEKLAMIEALAASLRTAPAPEPQPEPEPWDEEELAELLKHEPKSGHEIIEEGLFGAWADLPGPKDGLEWVLEEKRKRQEKYRW